MVSITKFSRKLKNKIILRRESIAKIVLFIILSLVFHYLVIYPFIQKWQQPHEVLMEDGSSIRENQKKYETSINFQGKNILAYIVLRGLHSKENWISGDQLDVVITLINNEDNAIIDPYFTLVFECKDKTIPSPIHLPDIPPHDRIHIWTNKIQGIPKTAGNCTLYLKINGTYTGRYVESSLVEVAKIDIHSPYCVVGEQWYRLLNVGMESIVYRDTLAIKNNCNESIRKLELNFFTPKKDISTVLAILKGDGNQTHNKKDLDKAENKVRKTRPSCPFIWIRPNKEKFIGEAKRKVSGDFCILTATANLIDTIEPNEMRFINLEYSVSNLVQNTKESYPFDDLLIPRTLPNSVIAITDTGRRLPIYNVEDLSMYIELPQGYEFFKGSRKVTAKLSPEKGGNIYPFYCVLEKDKWNCTFDPDWTEFTQMPRYDLLEERPILQFNGKIVFNSPNKIALIVRRAPLHQLIFFTILSLSSIFCCWRLWHYNRPEPKPIDYFRTYQVLILFYLAQMIALPRPYAIGLFDYYMFLCIPLIFVFSYTLEKIYITDLVRTRYTGKQEREDTRSTKPTINKRYVGVAKSEIYHHPDCHHVKNKSDLIRFENKEKAEQNNRKFCKKCNSKNFKKLYDKNRKSF